MGLAPLELHGRRGGKVGSPKVWEGRALLWRIWAISFFQVIPMWVTIEKCTRLGGRENLDSSLGFCHQLSVWSWAHHYPFWRLHVASGACISWGILFKLKTSTQTPEPAFEQSSRFDLFPVSVNKFPHLLFLPKTSSEEQGPSSLPTWGHSRHLSHPWRHPTPPIPVPSLREGGGILTSRSQEKPASTDCRPLGWSHDLDLDSGWSVLAPSDVLKQFIHDGARQFGQAC